MVITIRGIEAANYVKVATIGSHPGIVDKSKGMQHVVDQVIEFLRDELPLVLPDKPDLIVLAEACDRPGGLTREEQFEYYKVRKNQVLDFFASVAKENQCYIVFGTKWEQEDGIWRNSSIILDREGNVAGIYNKNFPTIGEIERGIVPGVEAPVFQCDFGRVACAICFDLNFDELRQRYAEQKPDIIVFSSMYHGGLVQANWAYSCRAFFVGSMGGSRLISEIRNPMGEIVATSTNYFHFTVGTINLDYCLAHLDNNWAKLRAMKKKYGEEVTIYDPGEIGAVMITSESDSVSAKEMVKEFEITLLDDYFNKSRSFRIKHLKQE
ncbi:hypothetical protein ES708_29886 [subsurface metagenome]